MILLALLLTTTSTLLAVTLPVQVYCPPLDVRSGENCRLLVVIVLLVVASFTVILSALSTTPSVPAHSMEILTRVSTSGTSSTSQVIVNTVPASSVEERSTGLPENDILGGGTVCMCINSYYVIVIRWW